jgi:hypothetical protein
MNCKSVITCYINIFIQIPHRFWIRRCFGMAICQYMLFSPPSLRPDLKDWMPSVPPILTPSTTLEGVTLEQLGIVNGLEGFSDYLGINDRVPNMITERSSERSDLFAGLRDVYPDLLAMEIDMLTSLIHKLEVQRVGGDSRSGGESGEVQVIRRDDIKKLLQKSILSKNNRTEGVLFWLDWMRDDADLDILTSRPPILPDISNIVTLPSDVDVVDEEGDEDEDDAGLVGGSSKTLKNAKNIVSVARKMLSCTEGKSKTIDTPTYNIFKQTI